MKRKRHHHTARHRLSVGGGDLEIESVPFFGTTWYTGGPSYWLRRALISVAVLAIFGVIAGIVGGMLSLLLGDPADHTAGLVVVGVGAAANIAGFVWTWRRMDRAPDARQIKREDMELTFFLIGWRAVGWIVLSLIVVGTVIGAARGQSVVSVAVGLGGLTFFGLAVCLVGPMLAVFLRTLVTETPAVRLAREEADEWHREHGHENPGQAEPPTTDRTSPGSL